MPRQVKVVPHRVIKAGTSPVPRVLAATPVASAHASPHGSFRLLASLPAHPDSDRTRANQEDNAGHDGHFAHAAESTAAHTCIIEAHEHIQFDPKTGDTHALIITTNGEQEEFDSSAFMPTPAAAAQPASVNRAASPGRALSPANPPVSEEASDPFAAFFGASGSSADHQACATRVLLGDAASITASGDPDIQDGHTPDTESVWEIRRAAEQSKSSYQDVNGKKDLTVRCEFNLDVDCQETVVGNEEHFLEGLVSDLAKASGMEGEAFTVTVTDLQVAIMSGELEIASSDAGCSPLRVARLLQKQLKLPNSSLRESIYGGNIKFIHILHSSELSAKCIRHWRNLHLISSFGSWLAFLEEKEKERDLIAKILRKMGDKAASSRIDTLSPKGGIITERSIGKVLQRVMSDSFKQDKRSPGQGKAERPSKVSKLVDDLETPARWQNVRLAVTKGGFLAAAATPPPCSTDFGSDHQLHLGTEISPELSKGNDGLSEREVRSSHDFANAPVAFCKLRTSLTPDPPSGEVASADAYPQKEPTVRRFSPNVLEDSLFQVSAEEARSLLRESALSILEAAASTDEEVHEEDSISSPREEVEDNSHDDEESHSGIFKGNSDIDFSDQSPHVLKPTPIMRPGGGCDAHERKVIQRGSDSPSGCPSLSSNLPGRALEPTCRDYSDYTEYEADATALLSSREARDRVQPLPAGPLAWQAPAFKCHASHFSEPAPGATESSTQSTSRPDLRRQMPAHATPNAPAPHGHKHSSGPERHTAGDHDLDAFARVLRKDRDDTRRTAGILLSAAAEKMNQLQRQVDEQQRYILQAEAKPRTQEQQCLSEERLRHAARDVVERPGEQNHYASPQALQNGELETSSSSPETSGSPSRTPAPAHKPLVDTAWSMVSVDPQTPLQPPTPQLAPKLVMCEIVLDEVYDELVVQEQAFKEGIVADLAHASQFETVYRGNAIRVVSLRAGSIIAVVAIESDSCTESSALGMALELQKQVHQRHSYLRQGKFTRNIVSLRILEYNAGDDCNDGNGDVDDADINSSRSPILDKWSGSPLVSLPKTVIWDCERMEDQASADSTCGLVSLGLACREDHLLPYPRVFVTRLTTECSSAVCEHVRPGDLLSSVQDEDVYGKNLKYVRSAIAKLRGPHVRLGFISPVHGTYSTLTFERQLADAQPSHPEPGPSSPAHRRVRYHASGSSHDRGLREMNVMAYGDQIFSCGPSVDDDAQVYRRSPPQQRVALQSPSDVQTVPSPWHDCYTVFESHVGIPHLSPQHQTSLMVESSQEHCFKSTSETPGTEITDVLPGACNFCGAAPGSYTALGKLRQFRRCARCRDADYCSDKCQRKHWLNAHKANCDAVFASSPQSSAASAGAPLSSDTIIAVARPLENPSACRRCGAAPGSLGSDGLARQFRRCAKCKEFDYCSDKCQRRHWAKVHKYECRHAAYLPSSDSSPAALVSAGLDGGGDRPPHASLHDTSPPQLQGVRQVELAGGGQPYFNPFLSSSSPIRVHPALGASMQAPQALGQVASYGLVLPPAAREDGYALASLFTSQRASKSSPRGILRRPMAGKGKDPVDDLEGAWRKFSSAHQAPKNADWRSSVRVL